MKKSRLLGALCACFFSLISMSSHAALVPAAAGGGLIYDTVLDITWAQPDALRTSLRYGRSKWWPFADSCA